MVGVNWMSKIDTLRKNIEEQGLDGYIIPMGDAFGSEYVPAEARRLEWLTGFTGSAGLAIVLNNKAAFFTDGRYTIQAAEQVNAKAFEIYNSADMSPDEWCATNISAQGVLGFDAWLFTSDALQKYYKAAQAGGFNVADVDGNLVDDVWEDQPPSGTQKIVMHDIVYAGESFDNKRMKLSGDMKKMGVDSVFITAPECVNWLLNIRGDDLPCTPFGLSYAMLHSSGKVDVYIDEKKLSPAVRDALGDQVKFWPIEDMVGQFSKLKGKVVQYDPAQCPQAVVNIFYEMITQENLSALVPATDPCMLPKACKNIIEVDGMRACHVRDGAAEVNFLHWLENNYEGLDEVSSSDKLEEYRSQAELFKGLSFDTISGFGGNGAIVHYKAEKETAKQLGEGMYLLDSGGQYLDGTTDITRTLYLGGEPSARMKRDFTLVLKGHIGLANAVFPQGTTGSQLDTLARQHLWAHGLDYQHGTGHGVGSYMNVHEGPQGISKRPSKVALHAGMVVSNEPGYYLEGEYGIRIENLVVVKEAEKKGFLCFETLTQVPIDRKLIDVSMLTGDEIAWVNNYHASVDEKVSPLLKDDALAWLKLAVKDIVA
jgi:Xaa-Pro aminopeptidase